MTLFKPTFKPTHFRLTKGSAALILVFLFLAAWLPSHPPRPVLATADLYTHLSVARHLVRGEGFQNDVTYPLSFAFPFAQALPQPLINRQPGWAILLTVPYIAAGGDVYRTVDNVRWLQIFFLGLVAWIGLRRLLASGRSLGAIPWLILLGSSPLLAYAIDWGFVEIVTSLVLLFIWLRCRLPGPAPAPWRDGLTWGLLLIFRLDLAWLPLLWWSLRTPLSEPRRACRIAQTVVVAALLLSPWLIRNYRVTGQPLFSLQAQAELVKDTRLWPQYSVYRQLTPQPMLTALKDHPEAILRKFARGLKFFARGCWRFFPPLLLGVFIIAGYRALPALRRKEYSVWAAPAVAAITLVLLCVQYSFFDHSLRHLLVIFPVLAWEIAYAAGRHWRLATAAVLLAFLPPANLPGWQTAAQQAARQAQTRPWQATAPKNTANGIYFFDYSAGPWFLDHPGVWRSPAAIAAVPALLKSVPDQVGKTKEKP